MEEDSEFVYLALERCRSTLSDAVKVRHDAKRRSRGDVCEWGLLATARG